MTQTSTNHQQPTIILITGNMASGKSTIAQALAEQLPQSVHLRGDIFRRMIVNGQAEMTSELSDEAQRQLQLRYDLAVMTAKQYYHAGFTVVYQDIVIGPALRSMTAAFFPLHISIIVLCPHADVLAARDMARGKTGYANRATVDAFDQVLRLHTPRIGYWLDTSDLSAGETTERLLRHLRQGQPTDAGND